MIKKSFIGFLKPDLNYERIGGPLSEPRLISTSDRIKLLLEEPYLKKDSILIKPDDKVKTGQKLVLYKDSDKYVVSTVTGKVASLSPYIGDMGKEYTEIVIDIQEDEEFDDQFPLLSENLTLETAKDFLAKVPGKPLISALTNPDKQIHTVVISCVDKDIMTITNLYVATSRIEALKNGISIIKKITGISNIILAVPKDIIQGYGHIDARVKPVDTCYPAGHHLNIIKNVLGVVVPEGKTCEDMGVCFFSAEAIASIGTAFDTRKIPDRKLITLIDKNGDKKLVSAKIGTCISDILNTFDISIEDRDRIIFGGPMAGKAVYSKDLPVCADTDAIMVQEKADISLVSDYPCINCGECIRICPANIPVNLLVRFLEAGQYEEAAEAYDLHLCIDCGLCSYVCVSKIPVFQYIQLGKYELSRTSTAEAINE
jgi:electron transport complex protein RnfC